MKKFRHACAAATLGGAAFLAGCSDGSDKPVVALDCADAAAQALAVCLGDVNTALGACFFNDNAFCRDDHPDLLAARDSLTQAVESACADGDFLGLGTEATVGRFVSACEAQANSIAWRSFGGPQGAAWNAASADQRDCLQTAHTTASEFFNDAFQAMNDCLADEACDAGALMQAQAAAAASAAQGISAACPALDELIALTPQQYVANTEDQLDCTLATAHDNVAPLTPRCGPSNVASMPARGEWSQIILDGDEWGSQCGDGTDYAVNVRLAPEGSPVDRVVVGLQGGGVCLFEDDCRSRLQSSPGLFNAQDDIPLGSGIADTENPNNPFADWTFVYLPYCNQDVFTGGGVVETFGDLGIPRYGAINLRAGMRVARDIIWKSMDETTDTGFRPDELIALFGGFSAGGYGTLYNYHWVLDDLQWPRTAAFPDAGGALDNGSIAGVRGLGAVKIPAWGSRPYLPPYCFVGDCAVGPDNYRAISPRLKQVPEQQYLILSNQKDRTQQGDAFFSDEAQWIDAMRAAYCDTKDLPGIQWYLTSDSVNSVHVVSVRDEFYYGDVAGERMADWFWRAVTDPDSVEDRAEEGNFTTDIPGSNPFPCALP